MIIVKNQLFSLSSFSRTKWKFEGLVISFQKQIMSVLICSFDGNSVVSVQDEQNSVRYEKRLSNDLDVIETALRPYQDHLQGCVIEST
jgi:hypothetical protein